MKTNKRQFLSRLRHMGVTVTLALLMLALSLAVLQWTVFARFKSSGEGGCGNFVDAVTAAENGDTIVQMVDPRNSDGATITKNLVIQGGWLPPGGGCTEANQTFTDTTDLLAAGFTFNAPLTRSGLFYGSGPVITIDPSVISLTVQHMVFEQQGFTTVQGGGISGVISNGAKIRLENIIINNSNSTDQGGGLYLEVRGGSQLVISDSLFALNNGGSSGGGFEIRVYDNSRVLIHNTRVTSNTAITGGGGRIMIDTGVVTVANSTFADNTAGTGSDLAIESTGSGPATVYLRNSTTGELYTSGDGLTVFNQQIFLPLVLKSSGLSAAISNISLSGSTYVVNFTTSGFTPQLPGQHVHFFFNTVPANEAGVSGSGPWKVYGSSSPFTGYTTADKPSAATQMCVLVANPNHSVQQGTGNCYPLP
ncbi:MAG: hypothetical protein KDF65_08335 [Anaerolineae bacterium]|nr:hypothetical protein [Anaerolineae bacterium]